MSACKRAFLYIMRKKARSVLLFWTIVFIMTLVIVGMAIQNSSDKTAKRLREKIGGYFKISVETAYTNGKPSFDSKLVEQVMEVDGIKEVNPMNTYFLSTPELTLSPGRYAAENDSKANIARVLGNAQSGLNEYFLLDILTLKEGAPIEKEDRGKVLISATLAEINGLNLGEQFYIQTEDGDKIEKLSVEIKGTFDESHSMNNNNLIPECDMQTNYLFTDEYTSNQINELLYGAGTDSYNSGVTFFAKDPKDINLIVKKVQKLKGIDWNSVELNINNSSYEESSKPLEQLSGMTSLMVKMILAVGMMILTLLLILWERDRVHEVGILLSFGIEKRKIVMQHFIESLSIYLLAFLLAIIIAVPVSGQLGERLYNNVVKEETSETLVQTYDWIELQTPERETQFSVELQPYAVLYALLAGILIVALAVGIACFKTVSQRPKEILAIAE